MSCNSMHHICPCQADLLNDAIDALSEILGGMNEYRQTLSMSEKSALSRHVKGITNGLSVIRRYRKV